jgi:protein gp37
MAVNSSIEWTDATWNVVTGCTEVSPGCDNCYAKTFAERWRGTKGHHFENGFDVTLRPERLTLPLRWKKPRRVFVNSMSDLFHKDVPDEYIARVWAVMAQTPQHTYQVLTKRHGRMRSLLADRHFAVAVRSQMYAIDRDATLSIDEVWPLPNVWLGVSVEDQQRADLRIPALIETPAAVRFLSCEPLLGPVDLDGPVDHVGHRPKLTYWLTGRPDFGPGETTRTGLVMRKFVVGPRIDWVIVGGESGHGARPMHPQWARVIRDQCVTVGVPFFFKQWGEYASATVEDDPHFAGGRVFNDPRGGRHAPVVREAGPSGTFRRSTTRLMRPGEAVGPLALLDENTIAVRVGKKAAGRELDGRTWDEFPEAVNVS